MTLLQRDGPYSGQPGTAAAVAWSAVTYPGEQRRSFMRWQRTQIQQQLRQRGSEPKAS